MAQTTTRRQRMTSKASPHLDRVPWVHLGPRNRSRVSHSLNTSHAKENSVLFRWSCKGG